MCHVHDSCLTKLSDTHPKAVRTKREELVHGYDKNGDANREINCQPMAEYSI